MDRKYVIWLSSYILEACFFLFLKISTVNKYLIPIKGIKETQLKPFLP